jgi:hypothetical protein
VRFIGIDPGSSGGIAAIDSSGIPFGALAMPDTDEGMIEAVDIFTEDGTRRVIAMIEQVHAGLFGSKAGRMGVTSAFSFGGNYRAIRMAFRAKGVIVHEASPIRWQTALNCRTRGDKNVSKAKAAELFPTMHATHAIADALLIAEFCRRSHVHPAS